MSTVSVWAEELPGKPAVVFDDGEKVITYAQLEQRSRRLAHLFRNMGCVPGDGVVVLMANEEWFFDVYWAAMRSGLYFTPINWHLQQNEVRYIVEKLRRQGVRHIGAVRGRRSRGDFRLAQA
jgi:acyl-CoA synthetase (AMP-forming)/AMP-acid ligase II